MTVSIKRATTLGRIRVYYWAMVQPFAEYRYSSSAAGRARLFFGASLALSVVLVAVLLTGWQTLSSLGLFIGIGLLFVTASTARAQLGRLNYTLRLGPDALEIVAPIGSRSIAWSEIAEVRRIATPRMFGPPAWACAVVARRRRGSQLVFVFDSGLQRAEQAFRDIVSRSTAAERGQ